MLVPELFIVFVAIMGLGALTDKPKNHGPCDKAKLVRDGGFYAKSCDVKFYEVRESKLGR